MTRILLAGSALPILAVVGPESASWALMIFGVGALGAILRRRRAAIVLAA